MLSRTEENYLRAISELEGRLGHARMRDIALEMGVKSPTATQMVQKLAEMGLADYRRREGVRLTREGKKVARDIAFKYDTFLRFFKLVGVPRQIAFRDACLLEHYLHAETARRLRGFLDAVEQNPWLLKSVSEMAPK